MALVVAAGRCGSQDQAPRATGRLEVIDGDTLRLADGRRVRLASIDTPEQGRRLYEEATDFTRSFVEAGPELRLEPPDPPLDHYGRLLADVLAGEESLSAGLVDAGLAWVLPEAEPELVASQAEAVAAGRGVHAEVALRARGPFLVTSSRFHRTSCRWMAGDQDRPLESLVTELLRRGLAPCRDCCPWPP